ncbi:MAG: bifunctional [glutamate--ammonia ligase]-adenylyl-L-tyrosine phosphorylase/[glutamate--ammonia-ligase] adenylyltransferase [Desulfobacterales bacterium]
MKRQTDRRWEAFLKAAEDAGTAFPAAPEWQDEARRIFSWSGFVAEAFRKTPSLAGELFSGGALNRPLGRVDYRDRLESALVGAGLDPSDLAAAPIFPDTLMKALRRFREAEMVRIAWRDLSGRGNLETVLAELSALADTCIDVTLMAIYEAFRGETGAPKDKDGSDLPPVVIGMGKLGAEELNFSSDVDLVFAYPDSGRMPDGRDAADFFSRVFRKLMRMLSSQTSDGFVFRVDTNLRPFGEGGPLVMSFPAMERYFQAQGRDWERYAWIKGRPVAGDLAAGGHLIDLLRPFVFRRYLDYGAFEALREMKRKIAREVRRRGMEQNIKLGAGGIREVEFFGQIFQLIRGGVAPALQQRGILKVLDVLADEHYIHVDVREELAGAYRFLRRVENRLQMEADRQTHDLPGDDAGRQRLAASMGFEAPDDFEDTLKMHRSRVHGHFSKLLEGNGGGSQAPDENRREREVAGIWAGAVDEEAGRKVLSAFGFDPPAEAWRLLADMRNQLAQKPLSPDGQQRLDRLMPMLVVAAGKARDPVKVLGRLFDLVRSVRRRTNYLALLAENPAALQHLVRLSEASSLIATFLVRRPVLLDELLDPRTLYSPPGRAELVEALRRRLASLPRDDLEVHIEEICIFRQAHTLRIAAADVTGTLPLMRVSDHLSDLAEVILAEVLQLAWSHLERRHGRPYDGGTRQCTPQSGFAVIAYGKLGGLELGYGSDLDLVFIHTAQSGKMTSGAQPIDSSQFFSRIGQRMVHILTAHTRAGKIYDVDLRLRPSGNSGPLVSHINAYEAYLAERAWTWEHQALIRARAVVGDQSLREAFEAVRRRVLAVSRPVDRLREEVAGMRERLRAERGGSEGNTFDLKQGPGGIMDIEFLVQYLVLSGAGKHPHLLRWSDNVRQLDSLVAAGLLPRETAHVLREAYLSYRSAAHRLSLQEKEAIVPRDQFAQMRNSVVDIYRQFLATSGF